MLGAVGILPGVVQNVKNVQYFVCEIWSMDNLCCDGVQLVTCGLGLICVCSIRTHMMSYCISCVHVVHPPAHIQGLQGAYLAEYLVQWYLG